LIRVGELCSDDVEKKKKIVFFLLDAALGSDSFKSLQSFLCLLLCLYEREKKIKIKIVKMVFLLLQNSLQDLKEIETKIVVFCSIGDGTCDGGKQATSVLGFLRT
jgi:hypothetical protein